VKDHWSPQHDGIDHRNLCQRFVAFSKRLFLMMHREAGIGAGLHLTVYQIRPSLELFLKQTVGSQNQVIEVGILVNQGVDSEIRRVVGCHVSESLEAPPFVIRFLDDIQHEFDVFQIGTFNFVQLEDSQFTQEMNNFFCTFRDRVFSLLPQVIVHLRAAFLLLSDKVGHKLQERRRCQQGLPVFGVGLGIVQKNLQVADVDVFVHGNAPSLDCLSQPPAQRDWSCLQQTIL